MKKILSFLKKDVYRILIIFTLTFLQTMTGLFLPSLMSDIVDIGIVNGDTPFILKIGGIMLLVAFIGILCQITARFISAKLSARFSKNLRSSIFAKVESFSLPEFDKYSTASLITRCTNDVTQVQHSLDMTLRMALSAPLTAIGGIIMAIRFGKNLTWILIFSCTALVFIMILNFKLTVPKFQKIQKNVDKLNLITRENLSGMRVIRAFNAEGHQNEKFDQANKLLTNLHLVIGRIMSLLQPMTMLIMNLTTIVVVWLGSRMVAGYSIKVGEMMAFLQYVMQIMFSFQMLSMTFIIIPRAMVSVRRIEEVLETEPLIKDPLAEDLLSPEKLGRVEFENVSFSYPNAIEPAVCNVSFSAMPGQTTAIIGSTGSGKSTLVNLIPRLYDVSSGSVKVDGVDVRHFEQSDLRDRIGYAPQKNMLFAGTIESNIDFARDIEFKRIEEAARIAQASKFISEKEEGFYSPIAQAGTNVSGGQKQRLSIARAIANHPKIYIFDDSFSSLDFKTESNLKKALNEETKDSTVLLITQRVSTIINADKIIVLDNGQVVGMGKHKDLLENCKVYYEIASSQLTKEELA